MPYWILERKLEKKGKDEVLMSEIGYKMFISEQTQKLVTPYCVPFFRLRNDRGKVNASLKIISPRRFTQFFLQFPPELFISQEKPWHASKNRFRTLLKRAYESNTLEKLKDFLSVEPQLVTG